MLSEQEFAAHLKFCKEIKNSYKEVDRQDSGFETFVTDPSISRLASYDLEDHFNTEVVNYTSSSDKTKCPQCNKIVRLAKLKLHLVLCPFKSVVWSQSNEFQFTKGVLSKKLLNPNRPFLEIGEFGSFYGVNVKEKSKIKIYCDNAALGYEYSLKLKRNGFTYQCNPNPMLKKSVFRIPTTFKDADLWRFTLKIVKV